MFPASVEMKKTRALRPYVKSAEPRPESDLSTTVSLRHQTNRPVLGVSPGEELIVAGSRADCNAWVYRSIGHMRSILSKENFKLQTPAPISSHSRDGVLDRSEESDWTSEGCWMNKSVAIRTRMISPLKFHKLQMELSFQGPSIAVDRGGGVGGGNGI